MGVRESETVERSDLPVSPRPYWSIMALNGLLTPPGAGDLPEF
jgi:hypothetical protein